MRVAHEQQAQSVLEEIEHTYMAQLLCLTDSVVTASYLSLEKFWRVAKYAHRPWHSQERHTKFRCPVEMVKRSSFAAFSTLSATVKKIDWGGYKHRFSFGMLE